MMLLCLLHDKSSKHLQRSEGSDIVASMVLSGLFQTEEAEAFAWNIGNLEVRSRECVVQVVVVSTINFRPRVAVVH